MAVESCFDSKHNSESHLVQRLHHLGSVFSLLKTPSTSCLRLGFLYKGRDVLIKNWCWILSGVPTFLREWHLIRTYVAINHACVVWIFVETWHFIKASKKWWVCINWRFLVLSEHFKRISTRFAHFYSEPHLVLGIFKPYIFKKMPTWSVPG